MTRSKVTVKFMQVRKLRPYIGILSLIGHVVCFICCVIQFIRPHHRWMIILSQQLVLLLSQVMHCQWIRPHQLLMLRTRLMLLLRGCRSCYHCWTVMVSYVENNSLKVQTLLQQNTPILLLLPCLVSIAFVTVWVCFADTNVPSASFSDVDCTNMASQSRTGNLHLMCICW